MHIPGERTIRAMVGRALRPIDEARRALGVPAMARALRMRGIDLHLRAGGSASADADTASWVRLHHRLSESSGYFFADNVISNESDYLAPAPALAALPPGLAYLGVGPEQSLSYVGIARSARAFVVDVRRDNARLHFLYRALFDAAESRSEWLALLLGRPYDRATDPGAGATIDEVLAHATRAAASSRAFRAAEERVARDLGRFPGLLLPGDRARVRRIHRWFFEHQLDLTFQVRGPRLRVYPTLRGQLGVRAPSGEPMSFLASETAFRHVQAMQRASRLVPVVGDLAGDFAVRATGEALHRSGERLGALYVSNVEQYLFERGVFRRWIANLRTLPFHPEAVILRAYPEAEDGRPAPEAPRTLAGQVRRSAAIAARALLSPTGKQVHVMPTIAHRLGPFLERADRYRTFRALVTDEDVRWR